MFSFSDYSNSMDFEYVPDWYRAERYEYSEPLRFMRRSPYEISLCFDTDFGTSIAHYIAIEAGLYI